MDGFEERRFDDGRFGHNVLKGGSGPPVMVLHEVAGLSPTTVAFARRLIEAHFSVHLPLFFGRPEQEGTARGLLGLFCVRREFSLLRVGKTSPVAPGSAHWPGTSTTRQPAPASGSSACASPAGWRWPALWSRRSMPP